MQMHLLLTNDIKATMPSTCKITDSWGDLPVRFESETHIGLHCFVEDTAENLKNWLRPFDGFIVGNGSPMMEQFTFAHIPFD